MWSAVGAAHLSTSQRCSWLYLTAQRDFVRSLAALSEELYTPGSGLPEIERRRDAAARRKQAPLHRDASSSLAGPRARRRG